MSDEATPPPSGPSGPGGAGGGSPGGAGGPGGEARRRRRRRRRGGQEAGGGEHAVDGPDDGGDDAGGEGAEGGERREAGAESAPRPPQEARGGRGERPQGERQQQQQGARSGRPEGRGERGGERERRGERRSDGRGGQGGRDGRGHDQRRDARGGGPGSGSEAPAGEPLAEGSGAPSERGPEASVEGGERRPEQQREPRAGGDQPRQRERRGDRERRERGRGERGGNANAGPGGGERGAQPQAQQGNRDAREGRRDGRDGGRDRGRNDRGGRPEPRNDQRHQPRGAAPASGGSGDDLDDDLFSPSASSGSATEAGSSAAALLDGPPSRETRGPRIPERGAERSRAEASWGEDDDAPASAEAKVEWGKDDDGPAAPVALPSSFPEEPDDLDPATRQLDDATDTRGPRGDVIAVVGVRFTPAGRISMYETGAGFYAAGDQVVVDSDRGPRVGIVAVASERRLSNDRGLRRVLRLANASDVEREAPHAERARAALRLAKDRTAALNLPVKVFRAELMPGGGRHDRLLLYITTEERIDLRELVRDLSNATNSRVELRQLGARDEAKAVGGIGSCGLTLCCTTWLPEFVPVSIKMAKDQGLVLNPTKVAGQCGRLKCCLVYEQAGYAELRKGLPKLGKRVVTVRGEGRVVEVDVLRQRVRVSYGPGESEVVPAGDVRPMFPSGNPPPGSGRGGPGRGRGPDADDGDGEDDEASDGDSADALRLSDPSAAPSADPSAALSSDSSPDPSADPSADPVLP